MTLLHWAVIRMGYCAKEVIGIIKTLLKYGINVNVKDKQVRAPLHLAVTKNSLEIAKLLLESGADLNIKDKEGRTPLDLLGSRGDDDLVADLFQTWEKVKAKSEAQAKAESSYDMEVKNAVDIDLNIDSYHAGIEDSTLSGSDENGLLAATALLDLQHT